MVGPRRFVLACLLGAGVAGLASPSPVHAAGCEAILGKWTWFTGGAVSINADGTIVHDPGNDGTWECTDPKRVRVTLRWRLGGYVNRLALSTDGNGLSSTDPSQSFVTAKRAAGEKEVGRDTPSRPAPSRPAPRAAEAPRPAPADPSPGAEAARPAPAQPAPRAPEAPRPAPSQPPSPPPPGPSPGPSGRASEGAGPCSGNACHSVKVLTEGSCVWLRNSSPAVLNVEIRLEKEMLKMVLEAGDMAKAGPSTGTQSPKTRRPGAPPAKPDLAQTRHRTVYDALSGSDRAVFDARVGTPAGCVAKPEAIVGYKASFASAEAAKVFALSSEPGSVPCSGDACQDLDHRVEEIKACRLTNTGRREIKVGIVMNGNREPSITTSVAPTKAMPLTYFTGCLRAQDIDRIEASYK
jgi:hypothetical protein